MNKITSTIHLICIFFFLIILGCKKNSTNTTTKIYSNIEILQDISKIIITNYTDLDNKIQMLQNSIDTFNLNPNTTNLISAKLIWKQARQAWEQSEAFLFGPISTAKIDPNIDTWPIAKDKLITINLTSIQNKFNDSFITSSAEEIKGFHAIEYILFGDNESATAISISDVQKKYMLLVVKNMKNLTSSLLSSWEQYKLKFNAPATTNDLFKTNQSVYTQVVDGLINICGEVGDKKMLEILTNNTPEKEESPFSKNSMTDFINNIKGVQNIYLGNYSNSTFLGLSTLIKQYSTAIDQKVKAQISATIETMQKITDPFGKSITTQTVLVQNAVTSITALKTVLETEVKPLIIQKITN